MISPAVGGKIGLALGGFALGAVVAYVTTKSVMTKVLEEEVAKVDEHYRVQMKELEAGRTEPLEALKKKLEDKIEENTTLNRDLIDQLGYTEWPVEHDDPVRVHADTKHFQEQEEAYSKKHNPQLIENVEEVESDAREPMRVPGQPYVIPFSVYFDDVEQGKMDVSYFAEDDIVIDDKEDIIENVKDVLGEEFSNYFGWKSDSEDTVYVRNEETGVDYAVTQESMSYQHYMVGEIMEKESIEREKTVTIRKMRADD